MERKRFFKLGAVRWVFLIAFLVSGGVLASPKSRKREFFEGRVQAVETEAALFVLDRRPRSGFELRVLAVSEKPLGATQLRCGPCEVARGEAVGGAGPPFAKLFRVRVSQSTAHLDLRLVSKTGVELVRERWEPRGLEQPSAGLGAADGVWPSRHSWSEPWERAYSAWIAHLFRPLPGQAKGWKPLHKALQDKRRNLLFDSLGLGEDDPSSGAHVKALADCGDTPYQLRAYFAWKLELPFSFRRCSRGNSQKGPRCVPGLDNRAASFDELANPVQRFNAFVEQGIAWQVHSGTLRTLPEDESSDFYPILLSRETIRPGTVFVDVGGHAMVISQWDETGLYAIDGHPDKTVTRKRFAPRFFPYAKGLTTGGFKAFRPLRLSGQAPVPLTNAELDARFSTEQYRFSSKDEFYAEMERLISEESALR